MIITICASIKHHFELYNEIAEKLSLSGNIVLTPIKLSHDRNLVEHVTLQKLHFKKIKISDFVVIIASNSHFGQGTRAELDYAKTIGKNHIIIYDSDIDSIMFNIQSEIRAIEFRLEQISDNILEAIEVEHKKENEKCLKLWLTQGMVLEIKM